MLRLRLDQFTIIKSFIAIVGLYILADDLNNSRKYLLSLSEKSMQEREETDWEKRSSFRDTAVIND